MCLCHTDLSTFFFNTTVALVENVTVSFLKNGVYFCCSVYLSFSLSYANTTSPTHPQTPCFFLLPLSFPLKLTVWGHSFSCRPMSLPPCMLLCSYDFHLILYILNITKKLPKYWDYLAEVGRCKVLPSTYVLFSRRPCRQHDLFELFFQSVGHMISVTWACLQLHLHSSCYTNGFFKFIQIAFGHFCIEVRLWKV